MKLVNSVECHSSRRDKSSELAPALFDELDRRIDAATSELDHLQALKSKYSKADRTREHSALVKAICAELGHKPDLRIAPMSPGGEPTRSGKPARCGPPGLADICGVIAPSGRLFMLEVKTGGAVQSRVQIAMMRVVRSLGGFYAVVRSVEDSEAAYHRAKRGERG